MKLYEFMGKELFKKYGIPVPQGLVASTPEEAGRAAAEMGEVVLKSQILTGKRGKAGGIKFACNPEEAVAEAKQLLGMELRGFKVEKILVEKKIAIDQELYLAITVDGSARQPVILASAEGGMDIEEVPEEKIVKKLVDVTIGVQPYMARDIAWLLGLSGEMAKQAAKIITALYRVFKENDAELVEINPLVVSGNRLLAADAKVTIDDEALYRQPELPRVEEKTETEKKAHALGLSYVELDGDIAIMANGAGITMATLDIIQHYGGRPANFLDAGGGAGVETTARALEILLATNPKVIFINIFGGITRCDDVANAFVQVKEKQDIPVPVVIRLVGTNEELGVKILKEHGIEAYRTMDEAARKAVELARTS
ncbi:ADP-forming succinate--CoA ligase subunit beta [Calderihabitans maritimus]|uniref:Succinate--CoA ligase [ADP-forming] subunit beta n=1 Tax=Calderihabitans maritimus TaxID=1246530 RepID=A0A1Z5HXL1_9FIRM|nr:ADP-forming succinate--CoA ligase subunit beta [Calderihabitans maritimus]GAW94262.1 succinyl-CoA synthetase subunit beta [Calderihabitans maritimus]